MTHPAPVRLDLERSEVAVLDAASRQFAADVASGQCTHANEDQMMRRALDQAMRLARDVDVRVSADGEVKSHLRDDREFRPLG